jgi:hypothetical protein
MTELARLYAQITLLRKKPQDIPASALLLVLTALAHFILNLVLGAIFPSIPGPLAMLLVVYTVVTVVWYAALLQIVGKSERFLQTTTAVFGFQLVLTPLSVVSDWLLRRFSEDSVWQFPVALIFFVVLAWTIAVNAHVVKAALEWSTASSVALVILQVIVMQLLLYSFFPTPR